MAIRIVIADDHPVVLMGLESLFSVQSDFDVVARCVDGREAVEAVTKHDPDILVLDLRLPRLDGTGVLRELREQKARVRTIVLSASLGSAEKRSALNLGARGLLLKAEAPQQLVQCVRTVNAGGWWLEYDGAREMMSVESGGAGGSLAKAALTEREREIAMLVADGQRNKEIARRLSITEGTVKVHLSNIYRKLDVTSRVGLALHSRQEGL